MVHSVYTYPDASSADMSQLLKLPTNTTGCHTRCHRHRWWW